MAKTRSKGPAGSTTTTSTKGDKKTASSTSSSSIYTLPSESASPPKLFILPKTATPSSRIVTLPNPRYNKPTRYLVCPTAGFFEFTAVSPPKSAPRSWLIQSTTDNTTAQTTQSPTLHLATPYDPLFLLLPALFSSPTPTSQQKRMFLSLDSHLDTLPDTSRHLAELLATSPPARALLEARARAVCDAVQAGDEEMYRVDEGKVVRELWGKAGRMVGGGGLPGSMEERWVRRELEAPVLGVKVARAAGVVITESQGSVTSAEGDSQTESQASVASTAATSVTNGEVGGDVASAMTAPEEVVKLQRLRVAFNFICSSYVAPAIAEVLKSALAKETKLVDFAPLDDYLGKLAKLRQEAVASRSDFSRKRAADEEEDERAEKRRKKEAEEKAKKANMSRGVKNLMKVNTSGMKKMSDFFKKKA